MGRSSLCLDVDSGQGVFVAGCPRRGGALQAARRAAADRKAACLAPRKTPLSPSQTRLRLWGALLLPQSNVSFPLKVAFERFVWVKLNSQHARELTHSKASWREAGHLLLSRRHGPGQNREPARPASRRAGPRLRAALDAVRPSKGAVGLRRLCSGAPGLLASQPRL